MIRDRGALIDTHVGLAVGRIPKRGRRNGLSGGSRWRSGSTLVALPRDVASAPLADLESEPALVGAAGTNGARSHTCTMVRRPAHTLSHTIHVVGFALTEDKFLSFFRPAPGQAAELLEVTDMEPCFCRFTKSLYRGTLLRFGVLHSLKHETVSLWRTLTL